MNIIITKTFKKDFLKILHKKSLKIFCLKLKKENFFLLEEPYKKFKFDINWTSIRWIIVLHNDKINLIPLFIIKKSNKKYWMNLILNKEIKKIIILKYDKSINDIENDHFEIY